jgi:hypothetical protein
LCFLSCGEFKCYRVQNSSVLLLFLLTIFSALCLPILQCPLLNFLSCVGVPLFPYNNVFSFFCCLVCCIFKCTIKEVLFIFIRVFHRGIYLYKCYFSSFSSVSGLIMLELIAIHLVTFQFSSSEIIILTHTLALVFLSTPEYLST